VIVVMSVTGGSATISCASSVAMMARYRVADRLIGTLISTATHKREAEEAFNFLTVPDGSRLNDLVSYKREALTRRIAKATATGANTTEAGTAARGRR